jgi:1-acyl-sn-glycerol-3-phosphate acyltransferase
MAEVPPRLIRRAITIPGTLLLAVLAVLLLPITLMLAVLDDVLHPRHQGRAVRAVIVVTVFLWIETWAIFALFSIWVRAGMGLRVRDPGFQRQHYELVVRYLDRCFALTQRLLNVHVELEGLEPASVYNRPLLVFCRHAGVGDSLLIVHALMRQFHREPRIVLKDLLQWAPAVDIALNRLPSAWITAPASPAPAASRDSRAQAIREALRTHDSPQEKAEALRTALAPELRPVGAPVGPPAADTLADRAQESIGALATGLDHNDAMVIFPEGGNFTPKRWRRAIIRLRREGRRRHAQQAQRMRNVLPPRPGGVLAALDAAPEADVVFVAHTGTDHLISPRDVWRALPLREPILMHWTRVPASEVPRIRDAQIAWLYAWWERIDGWVAGNRPVQVELPEPPPLIELPHDAPLTIELPSQNTDHRKEQQ